MAILELTGKTYADTPQWWKNFILECKQQHESQQDKIFTDFRDFTSKILEEQYHATKIYGKLYTTNDNLQALKFESEAHKNWFILRWS